MENKPTALDRIIHGLRCGIAEYGTEICRADDYKILISFNNVSFYDVKGNYNAVGERNIVNYGSISGDGNLNAGDLSICSLNDQQKVLLGIYNHLNAVEQARLITYADKLCRKAVTA